jgi:hypothetical protein
LISETEPRWICHFCCRWLREEQLVSKPKAPGHPRCPHCGHLVVEAAQ